MIDLKTQFSLQPHANRTLARYTGPRDPESIHLLYIFLRQQQWKGMLNICFTGNGGITDITFTDDKKLALETVSK